MSYEPELNDPTFYEEEGEELAEEFDTLEEAEGVSNE